MCAGGGMAVELVVIFFYEITREAIFSSAAYIEECVAGCGCRVCHMMWLQGVLQVVLWGGYD